jgi:glycosyltransferase involved in cell wall biosynthesis
VVIVHDWLTVNGGAEKVVGQFLELFPQADIITLVDNLQGNDRAWLKDTHVIVFEHWLLKLFPKKYRYFLPFMPRWIEQIDLTEYDLVISSSHAVAKGVICHPHQYHLAYIYSPMRYAWDLQYEHFARGDFGRGLKAWLIQRWLHRFRIWDAVSFLRPDCVVGSSHFIAKRIKQVCQRTAPVIYPPVISLQPTLNPIRKAEIAQQEGDFYIIVSRLVPYKGVNLAVESFANMPDKKLIIIGQGPELEVLQSQATANVLFKGYLPQVEMVAYMAAAKAFIHMAVEDFGIAPLEAQSLGVPVIGYGRGALLETIPALDTSSQPCGVLTKDPSAKGLLEAIQRFEQQTQITSEACQHNAQRFDNQRFKTEFLQQVNRVLANNDSGEQL